MYRTVVLLGSLMLVLRSSGEEPKLIIKPEAFQTLVNPNCSHCVDEAKRRKADLKETDPVLCWTRGKYDGGAIPFRFFLNPYRVISDTYGTFVYDPDAGYARSFPASLDYTFHGWRNGVMVMKHKDGTLFSCLTGVAFDGPRKGEKLAFWPTVVTDWGWYMKSNPNGVAYHMYEKYQPVDLPTKPHAASVESRGPVDDRMSAEEAILGVDRPSDCAKPRAYRISDLEKLGKFAALNDIFECEQKVVILWQSNTRTAMAYAPVAEQRKPTAKLGVEGELTDSKDVELVADGKSDLAPFLDQKSGSRFDIAGRGKEGSLKGWTLKAREAVQVKWFAWAAEYRETTVYPVKKVVAPVNPDPRPTPKAKEEPKTPSKTNEAVKEIAGTAEFLRAIPKHFATLKAKDHIKHTVTLLIDGETIAKEWQLDPDAEVKVGGWWGRVQHLPLDQRVWVWFKVDRNKQPRSIIMIADEVSQQDINGGPLTVKTVGKGTVTVEGHKLAPRELKLDKATYFADNAKAPTPTANVKVGDKVFVQSGGDRAITLLGTGSFESIRKEQQRLLTSEWTDRGLPGSVTFLHISGELEVMLDHEAMRWGRSLKPGDKVKLADRLDPGTLKPEIPTPTLLPMLVEDKSRAIPAVVKLVNPWRDRTQVRLVINGVNISEFSSAQRVLLKMTPPAESVLSSPYPPDMDRQRTREERIEWFLANIYCTCGVANNICTGHFYTLAACNPNGCAAPNIARKKIGEKIDAGLSNQQIFDDLRAERGALMLKPHLLP